MAKLTFLGLKELSPVQQALVSAALIALFSLACLALGQRSIIAWNVLISPVILFAFMNPLMSIFTSMNRARYIGISVVCFISLGFLTYLAGSLVSRLRFSDSLELIPFTFAIILFYFLSYVLSFIYKGVLGFLEEIDN